MDLILKEDDCCDRRCLEEDVLELGQQLVSRQNVGDFGLETPKLCLNLFSNAKIRSVGKMLQFKQRTLKMWTQLSTYNTYFLYLGTIQIMSDTF